MKTIKNTTTGISLLLLTAAPAFASGSQSENGGLLIWLFLGFCGLIVATQLIPAIVLGFGMIKGVLTHSDHHKVNK